MPPLRDKQDMPPLRDKQDMPPLRDKQDMPPLPRGVGVDATAGDYPQGTLIADVCNANNLICVKSMQNKYMPRFPSSERSVCWTQIRSDQRIASHRMLLRLFSDMISL
jgi:hypothetical protein